jgi:hypothetical protein
MKLTNLLENQPINELFKVDTHTEWEKYDDVLVTYISVNDKKIRLTLTATKSDDNNLKFANLPNDKQGYTVIFSVDERLVPTGNFGAAASVVIGKIVSVLFDKLKTVDWDFVYFSTGNLRLSKFYKATMNKLSQLLHGTTQISPGGLRFVIVKNQQLSENFTLDDGARVVKNPSVDGLINLVMRDSNREYRGLIDGNDIYWWPAAAAIYSKVGKILGYEPSEEDRLYINCPKSGKKVYFYRDGTWSLDKMQHHPQLKKFLDHDKIYFDNIFGNWVTGKALTESFVDNTKGWGNTPNNQNIDYLGLRVKMKPSQFLSLASYLHPEHATSVDPILNHLKKGGKIGAPFLEIVVPKEWSTGDLSKPAKIVAHDGRNRMTAIQELEGDPLVETHLFFRNEIRRRDIKPEWIEELNRRLIPQNQINPINGPFFITSLNESIVDGQDYIILKNPTASSLQENFTKIKLESPEFKNWFGNSKVVDAEGNPIPVYHGTGRPDRVANQFRKSRATAGPMSYFTEHPDIASNYTKGKADTSLADEGGYESWFKVKVKSSRNPLSIDRAWYFLPSDEKSKIAKLAPRVTTDDEGEEITLGDENTTNGLGNFKQKLKDSKNNFLMALVQEWLTSGELFGEEQDFIKVLKLAGMTTPVSYEHPHATYPAVYSVYLSIQNPLDTSNIQPKVIDALGKAVKRQPYKAPTNTMWNKKFIPAQEWYDMFLHPQQGTYAWTIIPDWVTRTLIALGYDGIKDVGGKGGGEHHTVWIPFYENQVKSAISNTAFSRSKSIIKEKIEINHAPRNFSMEVNEFNSIFMEFTINDKPYKFNTFEIKPLFAKQKGIWLISFCLDNDENEEEKYHITNTGNAHQVINSVGYCIQKLLHTRKDITGIYFTGNESSRIKLYDRLAPIFIKNGLKQELNIEDYISLPHDPAAKPYLFLKKQNINEVFNNIEPDTTIDWEKTDSMVSGTLPTQNLKTPKFIATFYDPRNDGSGKNNKIQICFKQDWKNLDGKKLFDLTDGVGYEVIFVVNGSLGITNWSGNNASSLLKKIIEKINGFIHTNHCDYIYFSASRRDQSRVKLYDAITSKLSKNGGILFKNFGYSKYYALKIDSMNDELNEVFHTSKEPANLDIRKQDGTYNIFFTAGKNNNQYEFMAHKMRHDIWHIAFMLPDTDTPTAISGTGGPFNVFNSVGWCINYLLKNTQANGLFFTASEEELSRIKLYDKISPVIEKNGLRRIDNSRVEDFVSMSEYSPEDQTYLFFKNNLREGFDISKEPNSTTIPYADDHNLQIDFMINGELYNFNASEMDDNTGDMTKIWEISFNLKKKSRSYFGTTKTGNAKQVFRSVGWCVDYLLKHHKDANGIFFTADSPSRKKLYDALSKLFLSKGMTRDDGNDIEKHVDLYNIPHGDEIYLFWIKKSIDEAGGTGLIVPGVNMPRGIHQDEIRRQAKKFKNKVDKNGIPPIARSDGIVKESVVVDHEKKDLIQKILADLDKYFTYTGEITIDDNTGKVSVTGNVYLGSSDIKHERLPVQFGDVGGNFYCINNSLSTLVGAPRWVGGNFYCIINLLETLTNAPKSVGGEFGCDYTSDLGLLRIILSNCSDIMLYRAPETVTNIIQKYLGKGQSGALQCAAELIRAGYKKNAKL